MGGAFGCYARARGVRKRARLSTPIAIVPRDLLFRIALIVRVVEPSPLHGLIRAVLVGRLLPVVFSTERRDYMICTVPRTGSTRQREGCAVRSMAEQTRHAFGAGKESPGGREIGQQSF